MSSFCRRAGEGRGGDSEGRGDSLSSPLLEARGGAPPVTPWQGWETAAIPSARILRRGRPAAEGPSAW